MNEEKKLHGSRNIISQHLKMLWFLQVSYTAVILLANWYDIRLIHIGGIDTDAGTLIFPFTFLLSDLVTEVYGYKYARRAIWTGFLFNLVFIVYGQIVVHLPSPDFALTASNHFDSLVSFNLRIIVASTISYFCSEPLNSYIMAKLKLKTDGKFMFFRFVISTVVASLLDSFIFGALAFAGTMSIVALVKFNTAMWIIKVVVEIFGLPLSLYLARRLKQHEQLDTYDDGTQFNLFSLDAKYNIQNNHYNHLLL